MTVLHAEIQSWPIDGEFVISRGAKREAQVIVVSLTREGQTGRGECVPYARYGETLEGVLDQIESFRGALEQGADRAQLNAAMPAGAARNALDCALWDLAARLSGTPVGDLCGLGTSSAPILTAYTISLGPPDEMAARAKWAKDFPLLKLKLGGTGDADRMRAVRSAAPDRRLIVDANEAWSENNIAEFLRAASEVGIELIEQPLPAAQDGPLSDIEHLVPICADESHHTASDAQALVGRYDAINVKLDKTGGLTEAIIAVAEARRVGLDVMVGCMVGTSLAMAPALLLGAQARWVDLDGPLLLANDRHPKLDYRASNIHPAPPGLWGNTDQRNQ